MVKVIRQVDENWFRGVNARGDVGIFPCSYVEMVKKPLSEFTFPKCVLRFPPGAGSHSQPSPD